MPQRAGPITASSAPELTQWLKTVATELANLAQGIEQLKTNQAQRARDNAELAGHPNETQEQVARHDAKLAEGLKKPRRKKLARDNLNMAEQLKASQEQIAGIAEQLRAGQEPSKQLRPPGLAGHGPEAARL